jgi:hypothetical protein
MDIQKKKLNKDIGQLKHFKKKLINMKPEENLEVVILKRIKEQV